MSNYRRYLRFAFSPWRWLVLVLTRITGPVMPGVWVLNILCQRILRINANLKFMVHFTSCVTGNVSIGRNVWKSFAISGACYIQGINGVIIGDNTIFGPGVKIISANHSRDDVSKWDKCGPIRIGCRCWIGANAVILPGAEIGDDAIIGAGAVVTRQVPVGAIAAGVPAKIIKTKSQLVASNH